MKFLYLLTMWIYVWFINIMLEIEPLILIIRNRLVLNDIELIAEGWVSRWVEPNQTAGRTGLRKSNQRKARYQHLEVMTHPTNQHAQHNWQFSSGYFSYSISVSSESWYHGDCFWWRWPSPIHATVENGLSLTHSRAHLNSWGRLVVPTKGTGERWANLHHKSD